MYFQCLSVSVGYLSVLNNMHADIQTSQFLINVHACMCICANALTRVGTANKPKYS